MKRKIIITDNKNLDNLLCYIVNEDYYKINVNSINTVNNYIIADIEMNDMDFYDLFWEFIWDIYSDYIFTDNYMSIVKCNINLGFCIPLDIYEDNIFTLYINLYHIIRYYLDNQLDIETTLYYIDLLLLHPFIVQYEKELDIPEYIINIVEYIQIAYNSVRYNLIEDLKYIVDYIYDCYMETNKIDDVELNKVHLEYLFNLDSSTIPNN